MYLIGRRGRRAGAGLFLSARIRALDPHGWLAAAPLMNASHHHFPHPFAPAGLIPGAALMDVSGA
ncbi:hypothetical protein T8T21_05540 [Limimaricola variabilis]|uniref:hypothetical protein n=1 Tax=Limimaricola variabilis TaxID=1492771 RepID=UPI002AC91B04|nr:hypothetical protein [Limimaricola variabilis]WPY95585.1 hypothetical protein T8T21_05540 [Limimaricola variabilis]